MPTILYIVAIAFGLSELGLSLLKRSGSGATSQDGHSLRLMWMVIGVAMFFGFGLAPALTFGRFGTSTTLTIGIVLALAGIALRWFSILWLGRWFTVNVAIAADQALIDTGPYRRVRHPSYTGALLAFLGLAIALGNAISLLVIVIPVAIVFVRRIRIEEDVLARAFGERWQPYVARTKRLMPGVW
jgi:protein-S-isoprenylcysteine O-methyltransferase